MKAILVLGILLVVLGAVALAYQGITYTTQEKVLDVGPFKATVETQKTIAVPPWVGAAVVAAGVVLVIVGARKRS